MRPAPNRVRIVALCSAAAMLAAAVVTAASDVDRMMQSATQRFGSVGSNNLRDWRDMLAQSSSLPEGDKLRRVNEFFNRRIAFEDDALLWKQADYWASPLETLGRAAGDCEDFSLAKYFSLIELGVPAAQLRLTYVRARIGGAQSAVTQAHMVVSYYATPDAEPLVLDNLITDIRPASRRPDLTPVFSFNNLGVWAVGAARPATPVERLSRWTELILRMKAEGHEP